MATSSVEMLYAVMPRRVTGGAYYFFRDAFRILEFDAYIDSTAETLDEFARRTGSLFLSADAPEPHDTSLFERMQRDGTKAVRQWREFQSFYAQLVFARLIDSFLTYLTDVIALIYRRKPEALRSNEQIRLEEALRYETMDALVEFLVERKVHQLSYQGMATLHSTLERELGFVLFEKPSDLERAILLVEKRNLIAHARGVVNKLFIQRTSSQAHEIGERLRFERDKVVEDLMFLAQTVSRVDAGAVLKFSIYRGLLRDRPTQASAIVSPPTGEVEHRAEDE